VIPYTKLIPTTLLRLQYVERVMSMYYCKVIITPLKYEYQQLRSKDKRRKLHNQMEEAARHWNTQYGDGDNGGRGDGTGEKFNDFPY